MDRYTLVMDTGSQIKPEWLKFRTFFFFWGGEYIPFALGSEKQTKLLAFSSPAREVVVC